MTLAENFRCDSDKDEVFLGFTVSDLCNAIDEWADPEDWRAPICILVEDERLRIVEASIVYYTGCEVVSSHVSGQVGKSDTWQVAAAGYRMGPCGP